MNDPQFAADMARMYGHLVIVAPILSGVVLFGLGWAWWRAMR